MNPKTEDFPIIIDVSAMREPFTAQFQKMGLKVKVDRYEKPADAIICLAVHGYINRATVDSAHRKLVKELVDEAERQCDELVSVGRPKKMKKGGAK
jgi:hypothetical protein